MAKYDDLIVLKYDDIDLIRLLPDYFKKILDFKEIMNTEEIELKELYAFINIIYNNVYIQTADEETIKYYENLLNLYPESGDSLEIRRIRVLNRLRLRPPYTLPYLKELLNANVGVNNWSLEIDYPNYTMSITIYTVSEELYEEVKALVLYIIPAHISWQVIQELPQEIDKTIYFGLGMVSSTSYSFTFD